MEDNALSFLCNSNFFTQKPIVHDDDRLIMPGGIFVLHQKNRSFFTSAVKSGLRFIFLWQDCIDDIKAYKSVISLCCTSEDIINLPEDKIGAIVIPVNYTIQDVLSNFYGEVDIRPVAITGTNGKTSVTTFVRQILTLANHRCASIEAGNIVIGNNVNMKLGHGLTTPSVYDMYKMLYISKNTYKVKSFIFETSSHGILQGRIDGIKVKIAAFTNLSQDHLDYHGTMDGYFNAKKLLFSKHLNSNGVAVLNADIPQFDELEKICKDRNIKIFSYGFKGKDIRMVSSNLTPYGQMLHLNINGKNYNLKTALSGSFQCNNLACAIGVSCIATNMSILNNLENISVNLKAPIGRMQRIMPQMGTKLQIYVDYAHTPDAFLTIFADANKIKKNRLIVVFGCGGDRDLSKRKIMGKIASELADLIFLTDDNPRDEDPNAIKQHIVEGVAKENLSKVNMSGGRKQAIYNAINECKDGDVVLILGKGNEDYQIVNNVRIPSNDIEIALKSLESVTL
ncbi:MAG: UDP-N-acetylmuramoyl-L-alanyl-D-glutamate--2,6-diaminopimelate ligase [Alphaproteobacteria bacterium]|nr:UDP-N-acetylmuramoyl-L-alanyl-D-glutamate--2,6-diaminopimelate ligase [Rickettsiales bacterium]